MKYEAKTTTARDSRITYTTVVALNDYGNRVGSVVFEHDGDLLIPDNVMVFPQFRRQGVATGMYDYAESVTSKQVVPSKDQNDDARGFWRTRKSRLGSRRDPR